MVFDKGDLGPRVFVDGYRLALEKAIPLVSRSYTATSKLYHRIYAANESINAYGATSMGMGLIYWNDAPERTAGEVIEALRKAAA